MRIIAGAFKGRKLAPVKGRMRPTAGKVRGAIFDILREAVAGARVLDLFAGTGALGIEALSRGAAAVTFVEDHPESLKVLRRNLERLGLTDQTVVLPLPVGAALGKLAAGGAVFDLALVDPPYGQGAAAATLSQLAASGLLAPSAWVVLEHSHRESLPEAQGRFSRRTAKKYGDTGVAFYQGQDPAVQEHTERNA